MRPGAAQILACPYCKTWLRSQAIELAQRAGITVWSDLRVDHAFWQSPARLARCAGCGHAFDRFQAEQVGVLPSSIEALERGSGWRPWRWSLRNEARLMAQFEAAPLAEPLSELGIELALADAGAGDAIDLRIQLWRHHNDRRRGRDTQAFAAVEAQWRDNQHALLDLLDSQDELHSLLMAEIHRQRGDFHRAMCCLSGVRKRFGREKAAMMGWVVEGRSELMIYY